MIKILHSADWHLDSPLLQRSPEQTARLQAALRRIPEQVAALCKKHSCDLMLLSGDLFDGPCAADTLQAVRNALEEAAVPVFISPGNHDFVGFDSPWLAETWPGNVHIFTHPVIEAVEVAGLDCTVVGAGYTGMDCAGLLGDYTPRHDTRYSVGILHGDPTQVSSPYCPITTEQVLRSGLDYLALGHIHKGDSFRAGKTLCAWPGCPQGRGYDETGDKGALLVTLEETAEITFLPLDGPRFYDLEAPADGLSAVLPPVGNSDFYRITLTGEAEQPDLEALKQAFSHFPNLELRDKTTPPKPLWDTAGDDTLEGIYFHLLRSSLDTAEEPEKQRLLLAAKISRQLLDGQEVVLP